MCRHNPQSTGGIETREYEAEGMKSCKCVEGTRMAKNRAVGRICGQSKAGDVCLEDLKRDKIRSIYCPPSVITKSDFDTRDTKTR